MRTARLAVSISLTVLLAGGYAASQFAAIAGDPAVWARQIDVPSVKWLSLVLLLATIVLSFVPDQESAPPPDDR